MIKIDFNEILSKSPNAGEMTSCPCNQQFRRNETITLMMQYNREFINNISTIKAEEIISLLSHITSDQIIQIMEEYFVSDYEYHKKMQTTEAYAKIELISAFENVLYSPEHIQELLECLPEILSESKTFSILLHVYKNEQE